MAMSSKDQINLKLEVAKNALESAIRKLEDELKDKPKDEVRETPELYKKFLERASLKQQLDDVYKLFTTGQKKKEGTRMILALCHGELKDGSPCEYKIRASMSMYLRGVPNCPDPMCKRRGKPLEVEVRDTELDKQIEHATGLDKEIADAHARREKDIRRAQEANMRGFSRSLETGEAKPVDDPFADLPGCGEL